MAFDPCNPCCGIPANIGDQLFYQMATNLLCQIVGNTAVSGNTQAVSSCLEVTTGGAWGSVGDRITETRWYDISTDPPTLLSILYFNENTLAAVTGITSGNTQPCPGDDLGESCANPMFAQLCAGSAIVGNFRIDQTTPGTTNGVQVNAALPAGSNLIGIAGIDQVTANANNVQITDTNSNELKNIPVQSAATGSGTIFAPFNGLVGVLRIATKTVTSAGATTTSIPSTAHGAAVGNIIQIISGALSPCWSYVSAVPDANTITLGYALPAAPANGVSFIVHQQVPLSAVGGQASTDNGSALIVAHGSLGGVLAGSSFALKTEDSAHMGDGGVGFGIVSRQEATPTNGVGTDGDCQWLKGNIVGALYNEPSNQLATWAASTTAGAAGGITTGGASVLTNSAKVKRVEILNTTDQIVQISLDAGTTWVLTAPATTGVAHLDLGANGRWSAANVHARSIGSNTSSGSLYLSIMI